MAPALVEHSAAKERNSISKEYSKIRGCLSQFDIDLLNKISHQYPADSFDAKGSSLLEMNNSDNKDRQNISFANSEKMVSLKEVPVISIPKLKSLSSCEVKVVGYKNGTLNVIKEVKPVPISDESRNINSTQIETTKECKTDEERPSQPVATMDNSSILDFIRKKKQSCGLRYYDLNCNMTKLDTRLRQLQAKNVMSHVSSQVNNKPNSNKDSKYKAHDSKNRKESHSTSSGGGIQLHKTWEDFKKVHDMINFRADDTDGEDDFEIRQRVPVSRSKKKSDNPPPPPEALHNWKIKRAHIGSQCSWLNLKITSLDRKIAEIDKLLIKNKLEKKCKNGVNPTNNSDNIINTSEDKSGNNLVEEQICQRVLPYTRQHRHKYVRSKQNPVPKNHNCRCLPSIASCRLCLQSQKQLTNDTRTERTAKLDWSYHANLSNENDVSLSFLLEETLRQQRINTKVTISKPTKKKKKQKSKDNEHPEKDPTGSKSSVKLLSDKNHVRTKGGKGDRLKFEELSRKRSSGVESGHSCRSRKHRKLSDTEDCWKPSTPTELASPYSQNNSTNSSNSFFPIKQQRKKASTGGDYDINNIVIPYSMAAATRVERIQYKEIPTPGWRNIPLALNGNDESEEIELTDDESYLERHSRCEANEKRNYTDYYQPVVHRRRSNHLSESTASGPPSPLVVDASDPSSRHAHIHTPIDSPVTAASAALNCRMANIIHIPDEEREPSWPLRSYPLSASDCKNLCIDEPSPQKTVTTRDDSSNTSPTFSLADTSKYVKYSDSSTSNVMSALFDSPKGTITPNYTPTQTPMPSPLCSPGGTPTDVMGGEEGGTYNPDKWTVKVVSGDPKHDVVSKAEQSVRTGIVLKLAKK